MSTYRKKLIEVALPLEAINAASAREKAIRQAHPSSLHLWWARRPLAACRAVLFAQLVDDPSANPDEFPTEEDQERERQRLFRIIEDLVLWENTNNEMVLERARAEIRKSCGDDLPPVYDPFCGGGSIPLEAQRLGLKAYGSDLNPVAVMISKAVVEVPPKFAGHPPVNPKARSELKRGGVWNVKGAQGLAEDVSYYGKWIRDEAEKRIGHLYPQVDLPPEHGGGTATVIAWIWAKTVASSNPICEKAQVPLVKSFELSRKANQHFWVEPIIDASRKRISFRVKQTQHPEIRKTVERTSATCILSGEVMSLDYIQQEGQAGRLGSALMAIVAKKTRGRIYLDPNEQHEKTALDVECDDRSLCSIDHWRSCTNCVVYGYENFGHLFTNRQLVALTTFSDLIKEVREKVLIDAQASGLNSDNKRLSADGSGADAYADAVTLYLTFILDKLADLGNSFCPWEPIAQCPRHLFGRQAIPMVWDYAEANPFSESSGSWHTLVKGVSKALETCFPTTLNLQAGKIFQADAMQPFEGVPAPLISTDPPYYDNIPYSNLSDFFYVWMRKSLTTIFPELFRTIQVPRLAELVANQSRHGGARNAERFFLDGMTSAIGNMVERSAIEFPTAIFYAFKQSEVSSQGVSSTGWATFLEAVVKSGFTIVGTWPIRTENATRMMGQGSNALASSIVLVCRKRAENAPITIRSDFLKALKQELPAALKLLQYGNIAPVDMAQASIGPGMAIFTRYQQVLESDDSPMTMKTALQLINQALDEYFSEQEAEYDPDTRFAITWFETHGMETGPYGTAETLATARGVAVAGVVEAGILEARGGNVRLLRRDEMPDEWDPATDKRLCVWECTQHLIRVLETEGEGAAADLLGRLGARGEVARDLAYRLYGICERKKWAEEARAYNGLVIAWPELTRLAARGGPSGPAQEELLV